jgi:uncharacterized protein (DUF983 family)
MADKSIATGVRRGVALRCPNCGKGHLFTSFLTVSARCEVCGTDNTIYPSDDAPPYVTIVLVGHLVVPLILWMETAWAPAMRILFAIWLPTITVVTIALLPFVKGVIIGFAWAADVTRQGIGQ